MFSLTGGRFVAVVAMSEVLWVLYNRNSSHSNHHCSWSSIQCTGANDPMVNMMKGTGRVFLTTYHCHRTYKDTDGVFRLDGYLYTVSH